jgi:hypothetical protein
MNAFLFWLAAVTAAAFLLVMAELVRGRGKLRHLSAVEPLPQTELPLVSVVVAARDEERNVEEAMGSILAQDLARMELVVVDDRSADRTGEILDRMAAADPRLRVVHVRELPAGWLGKNHALELGAAEAGGELILFTDADIVMAPDTVRLAASYMERERLDHLTMAPRIDMPGFLLQAFGVLFRHLLPPLLAPVEGARPPLGQPHRHRRLQPGARVLVPAHRHPPRHRHAPGRRHEAGEADEEERPAAGLPGRREPRVGGVVPQHPGGGARPAEERLRGPGLPRVDGGLRHPHAAGLLHLPLLRRLP